MLRGNYARGVAPRPRLQPVSYPSLLLLSFSNKPSGVRIISRIHNAPWVVVSKRTMGLLGTLGRTLFDLLTYERT